MLFYAETIQSPRLALAPIIGGSSTLSILELTLEDIQDNILAAIGDALTTALEEEMAVESTAT